MQNDVITKFQKGLDSFLTKEDILKVAPLVYAEAPTNNKVSDKYLFVNTGTVIEDLAKLNWFPVTVSQRKARKSDSPTIYSKHMVSFQNPDIMIKGENGDDAFPRIILTTSHDGTCSFKFSVGIYRLVCSNGLVVADEEFSNFAIRHKGYTFGELQEVIKQAVLDLPNKVEIMNKMSQRILTQEEKEQLAIDAMLIRAGIKPNSEAAAEFNYDADTIEELLTPTRPADKGEDLWKVMNILQEKITQGGFSAALKGAKVRKVKKIKSFERDLEVNKLLFKQASALV
jgi:hypothetical protein